MNDIERKMQQEKDKMILTTLDDIKSGQNQINMVLAQMTVAIEQMATVLDNIAKMKKGL